ncbi:Hypothetical protein BQ3484_172 [Cedratvirus A11]|uniref:Uncharacterized protein n=1 Tax=Cedratvirus A11 TaxID=1903266 RepID=A0A1M7XUI9_9VIRU|nr:Hypothetical protein BQ3484_172 [Cedratvirus A11]SHO33240.1 Hypothetical protein BQ3484_172 [Cedratvirus A11]
MARSLYSTVLKTYDYIKLKDLCFAPGSTFGNAFDCEWKVWRDKAKADFGISEEFFDLVRTLSGPQRYLQISTYIKLSPLSGVRVYENGTIEGVYEAWKGYREARLRKDPEMVLWFAERIKPEQQTGPRKNILQKAQALVDTFSTKEEKVFYFDYDKLAWLVKHGKIRELDQIIHDYFTLPKGFSIERDVPYVPFWKITDKYSALLDLPLQDYPEEEMENLVNAISSSGDVRIVDFFRSIFRDRLDLLEENYFSAWRSLILHGKPEETYGIEVRFFNPEREYAEYEYMAENVLGLVIPNKVELKSYFLTSALGDITYLTAVLPFFPKEVIEQALSGLDGVLYPLSKTLLESYI